MATKPKGFADTPSPEPELIPDPFLDDEPPALSPLPSAELIPTTPAPTTLLWFGATLDITSVNKEAILTALNTLSSAAQPMYLLEVEEHMEMLIALNAPAIALFGATKPEQTVPRFFSVDWKPARDLRGDRSSTEFSFTGILKCFDGTAKQLKESHRKIADNLWLVTIE